jgi:trigger factor
MFRERIGSEYKAATHGRLKRQLLDHLAAGYPFEVPPGMVDLEFEAIWKNATEEMQRTGQSFADEGSTEEAARAEYREIAERRVRLGLILADLGTKNEVKVEPQELQSAVIAQAQRFPGQERRVFEYFQKTPGALDQLRAPIYEDKVVDFVIGRAKVEDRTVSVDELMADPEDDVGRPVIATQTSSEEG